MEARSRIINQKKKPQKNREMTYTLHFLTVNCIQSHIAATLDSILEI